MSKHRTFTMIGAGLLVFQTAWAAQDSSAVPEHSAMAMSGEEHAHHHGMHMSEDEHAAHRAAMNTTRYTVSNKDYEIPDVELIDADGATMRLRTILDADKPVALNFIFTTCTTICPVMTATFAQMQRKLGDTANKLQVVSISIDPEYDRPDVLKAYGRQFHAGSNWTFLTGDSKDILTVLQRFETFAGSKMNHQPVTFLKHPGEHDWIRIDGLASGENLAQEIRTRLFN
jgi:protein SCO1/2